jgi:hypothetical protein
VIAQKQLGAVRGTSVLRAAFVFCLGAMELVCAGELHAQNLPANSDARAVLASSFHTELAEELRGRKSSADSVRLQNRFLLEANPVRGTISYARAVGDNWFVGPSVGFGFPQIDVTLSGDSTDFREYLHIGLIARREFSREHVLLEFGGRAGFADYRSCTASDCWPGVYGGPSVLVAVGGKRVKVGSRFTAGLIKSPGRDAESFASVSPLNVLVALRF